jgi:hypothetical protein
MVNWKLLNVFIYTNHKFTNQKLTIAERLQCLRYTSCKIDTLACIYGNIAARSKNSIPLEGDLKLDAPSPTPSPHRHARPAPAARTRRRGGRSAARGWSRIAASEAPSPTSWPGPRVSRRAEGRSGRPEGELRVGMGSDAWASHPFSNHSEAGQRQPKGS